MDDTYVTRRASLRLGRTLSCVAALACITGCYNTSSMRTGRVLADREIEYVWLVGVQSTQEPLVERHAQPCPADLVMPDGTQPVECGGQEHSQLPILSHSSPVTPMIGFGGNRGLGDGWEFVARGYTVLAGAQIESGIRYQFVDAGRFAAAANVHGSLGLTAVGAHASGRAGLDLSVHSAVVDGYLSPQWAWWGLAAAGPVDLSVATQIGGATLGTRWPVASGVALYTEIGLLRAFPSGISMWTPMIGLSHH